MLRIPFLRNILLLSILFATIFPAYDFFYIIPSYQRLLIHETEHEAARFVRFLLVSNSLDKVDLRRETIPLTLVKEVEQLKQDGKVVKLRIFSPAGEILFSSDAQEVGTVNTKSYFRQTVSAGNLYSKIVHKASVTAEGVMTDLDVVETYVPVMLGGEFHGAMEVYSDITSSQQRLNALSRQSFLTLLSAALCLLLMTLLVLFRAHINIKARADAENALLEANEVLETRVVQRTVELSTANDQLAAEIVERKKAQSAQKEAFIAISEARDRIDTIISSVSDALLVTDHRDSIMLINPAAEALFKVRAENVVGRRLLDVIGFDDLLLEISKARNELRTTENVEFDFSKQAEGVKRIYQGRASRLSELSINGRGLVLLIHDVTRERHVEQMKSEFVSMAAHELQTPLTMILGYSELLLTPGKTFTLQETQEFLSVINEKAVELSRLIDDILDLSRIEDGRGIQLNFSIVNVTALILRLLKDFERTSGQHRFFLEQSDKELFVDADEARLTQILENLLGNAVKYSPAGGMVRVVLGQEENWLRLEVIDQGIGMTEEEIANAFERFYRGDASNTAVRGTGLGLSITKYIVDAHGGKIEIFSRKGKGTRLEIRLPLFH